MDKALEPLAKAEAKERQKEHGKTAPGKKRNTGGKLPQVKTKTRAFAAAATGKSATSPQDWRKLARRGHQGDDPPSDGPW